MKNMDNLHSACSDLSESAPRVRWLKRSSYTGLNTIIVFGLSFGLFGVFIGAMLFATVSAALGAPIAIASMFGLFAAGSALVDLRARELQYNCAWLMSHMRDCEAEFSTRGVALQAAFREYGRDPESCAPQLAHLRLLEEKMENTRLEFESEMDGYAKRVNSLIRFDEPTRKRRARIEELEQEGKALRGRMSRDMVDVIGAPAAAVFGAALVVGASDSGTDGSAAVGGEGSCGGGGGACGAAA